MLKVLNINTNELIPQIDNLIKNREKALVINDGFSFENVETINIRNFLSNFSNDVIIDDITQEVIIRDIIVSMKNGLKIVTESDAESISLFISETMRENVSKNKFEQEMKNHNFIFEDKLSEILSVYEAFLDYLEKNSLSTPEKAIRGNFNKKLSKYDEIVFLPLNSYDNSLFFLILSLLKLDKDVILVFDNFSSKENSSISSESRTFKDKIVSFVQNKTEYGVDIIPSTAFNKSIIPNDLITLKSSFLEPVQSIEKKIDGIKFYSASSPHEEMENTLFQIKDLCKTYSYSDIAIVVNDLTSYTPVIREVFKGIPIFFNCEEPFSKSYLYKFISLLLTYCNNSRIDINLLNELVRFPWFNITVNEQNIFDLFFLRFGNNFDIAIKNGEVFAPIDFEIVKKNLEKVSVFITPLKASFSVCSTVKDFLITLTDFLSEIKITEYLHNVCSSLSTVEAYKLFLQWKTFTSIFQKLNVFFPDKKVSLSEFISLLSIFAFKTNIAYSSNNNNTIEVSDMDHLSTLDKKILFVVGNNDTNEAPLKFSSIINSFERKIINYSINSNFKTDEYYVDLHNYKIQNLLTFPREKLFISWSKASIAGKELYPAAYIQNLSNLLKESDFDNSININKELKLINLLTKISDEKYAGVTDPIVSDDFVELCHDEYYAKRLNNALNSLYLNKDKINSKTPESIYKDTEYFSATRLENFNKCPFKHFVDYGILPQKLNIFGEDAVDKGDYFHSAFNLFFDEIINNKIELNTLSEERITKMLIPIFEEIEEDHNDGALVASFKNLHEKEQIRKKATVSIINSVKQLNGGSFLPVGTEFNISKDVSCSFKLKLSTGKEVFISGVIDRFDLYNNNLRVIDYKSSAKSFNLQEMEKGIQLQLPLYASAMNKKYNVIGMYYFHVQNPILDIDKKETSILKKYQLSGPTVASEPVLVASDNSLLTEDKSLIIPVSKTKTGKFTNYSQIYTKKEFNEILEKSQQIAQDTINRILSGETIADPVRNTSVSPCTYCDYNKICQKW